MTEGATFDRILVLGDSDPQEVLVDFGCVFWIEYNEKCREGMAFLNNSQLIKRTRHQLWLSFVRLAFVVSEDIMGMASDGFTKA